MNAGRADDLLLGGKLAPITSEIGFIELPLAQAVASYGAWQHSIQEPLGRSLTKMPVSGSLEEALCAASALFRPARFSCRR